MRKKVFVVMETSVGYKDRRALIGDKEPEKGFVNLGFFSIKTRDHNRGKQIPLERLFLFIC